MQIPKYFYFRVKPGKTDITLEYDADADVVEVRHGEWVDLHGYMTCTVCGFGCDDPYYLGDANYCPNCGAKMDGGVSDA